MTLESLPCARGGACRVLSSVMSMCPPCQDRHSHRYLTEVLGDVKIMFWVCPDGHSERDPDQPLRQTVRWDDSNIAWCLTCGKSSSDER